MKNDGVILLLGLASLAMFGAGAAMVLRAWVFFIACLVVYLVAAAGHAWCWATLRQRIRREVKGEEKDV